jgi:flagellar assembly factor FliW
MEVNTRIFGTINIEEEKLIHFVHGIIGFPELTDFALIHDSEKEGGIRWLQSMQEPQFALPVVNPLDVIEDYDPQVEDELLKPLGDLSPEDMLVLVTVTVPSDLTKMSINLRGPIIINAENKKACQIIVEGEEYPVKYMIYDILKSRKAGE